MMWLVGILLIAYLLIGLSIVRYDFSKDTLRSLGYVIAVRSGKYPAWKVISMIVALWPLNLLARWRAKQYVRRNRK